MHILSTLVIIGFLIYLFVLIYAVLTTVPLSRNDKKLNEINELISSLTKKYVLIRNDGLFNVDNFNRWFNSPKPKEIYAHSGIFGRLDKLSHHHYIDYIASFGLNQLEAEEFYNENINNFNIFEHEVRKDWIARNHKDDAV